MTPLTEMDGLVMSDIQRIFILIDHPELVVSIAITRTLRALLWAVIRDWPMW